MDNPRKCVIVVKYSNSQNERKHEMKEMLR